MKGFFSRSNAFNFVIFGSIFLMAVFKSVFCSEQLSEISVILSLLILLFSLFSLLVNVFEDVNDIQTERLVDIENFIGYDTLKIIFDGDIDWYKIQEYSEHDLKSSLKKNDLNNYQCEEIIRYSSIAHSRINIRKIRKVFLAIYYFFLMLILTYLFLANDLSPYVSKLPLTDLAIWSFVIILFEILLKSSLVTLICEIIYKHKKINL